MSRTFTAAVIVVALYWGRPVFLPVSMAALLTFVLNPVVYGFQRAGAGPLASVVLAVSIVATTLTGIGIVGSQQVTTLLADLPANTSKVTAKLRTLRLMTASPTTKRFENMMEEIERELTVSPDETEQEAVVVTLPPDTALAESPAAEPAVVPVVLKKAPLPWMLVTGYLGSAVEVIATMAFTFVLLVCFLLEREGLRDRLLLLAGKAHLTLTSKALEDATWRVSRYILMVAAVNGGFGLFLGVGLFFIGVPYAILWGCMAATLRFIPYLGPWMGALFPIAMSVATADGWTQPVTVIIYVSVLELITNNLVEPIVFGRTIGVSPTALLISAAFWLFLWGPIGLILSAPFAVVLVVLGKNIPGLRFLNLLLGDQAALSADVGLYQRLLVHDAQHARMLIQNQLAHMSMLDAFDDLLIPALNYVKRDFLRGLLTTEERDELIDTVEAAAAAARLAEKPLPEVASLIQPGDSVMEPKQLILLGCSADGQTDRTALMMLRYLLDPEDWSLPMVSEETLTSEIAAQVAESAPAAICIAALPPKGLARARYLCKRLKAAAPEIPIVVGRWGARSISQTDRDLLKVAGASAVTASLAETMLWLESRHPCLAPAKLTGSHSSLDVPAPGEQKLSDGTSKAESGTSATPATVARIPAAPR